MASDLLSHLSMESIFINSSKILRCSSFCFWSYRLYLFPELLRSLPLSLTYFSYVVSYICNTVRFFWSESSLKERSGKTKTQPSGNWEEKACEQDKKIHRHSQQSNNYQRERGVGGGWRGHRGINGNGRRHDLGCWTHGKIYNGVL